MDKFHTMVRTRITFFGEDGVSRIRKPTRDRRTPVRADVFQHASMLAGGRRPLAARTPAARRKSSAASPIAPPRLPTGRRSRRSIVSTLQRCQLLLRHRRDRPRTKGQPFGTKGQRSATKGRDYWTKGQDPILGSEIPRSPYDLLNLSSRSLWLWG